MKKLIAFSILAAAIPLFVSAPAAQTLRQYKVDGFTGPDSIKVIASRGALGPVGYGIMRPTSGDSLGWVRLDTITGGRVSFDLTNLNFGTWNFFGHSWVDAGGAFVTFPTIFCKQHWCNAINQGDGSGIGVSNPTFIGRVHALVVNDSTRSVNEIVGNDMKHAPATPTFDFARVMSDAINWQAINTDKRRYYDSASYVGSWILDSLYGTKYKKISSPAATVQFTTTGSSIVLGLLMSTTGGSFAVSVDGNSMGSYSLRQLVTSYNGVTLSPINYVISGLANTAHTVILTSETSSPVYFSWYYGGDPSRPLYPFVVVGGESNNPGSGITNDSLAKFNRVQDSLVAVALTYGGNVIRAPFMLDTSAADSLFIPYPQSGYGHPSVKGATAISDSIWTRVRRQSITNAINTITNANAFLKTQSVGRTRVTVSTDSTGNSNFQLYMNNGVNAFNVRQDGKISFGDTSAQNQAFYVNGSVRLHSTVLVDGVTTLNDNIEPGISIRRGDGDQSAYVRWMDGNNIERWKLKGWNAGGRLELTHTGTLGDSTRFYIQANMIHGGNDSVSGNHIVVGYNKSDSVYTRTARIAATLYATTLRADTVIATKLYAVDTASYKPNFTCDTCTFSTRVTLSYAQASGMLVTDASKRMVSLASGGALSVLRYNSANTGVEAAVPTGTGAPVNAAGATISGTWTSPGTWSGNALFNAKIALLTSDASVQLNMSGNATTGTSSQYGFNNDLTFPSTATTKILAGRIRAQTVNSSVFTTTGDITALVLEAFVKGNNNTVNGNEIALDIASQSATVGGSHIAIRTGAVGRVLFGDTTAMSTGMSAGANKLRVTATGNTFVLGDMTVGALGTTTTISSGSTFSIQGNWYYPPGAGGGLQKVCVDNGGQIVIGGC